MLLLQCVDKLYGQKLIIIRCGTRIVVVLWNGLLYTLFYYFS